MGETISVNLTPNFSLTTTTSPRATSFWLTRTSKGSPTSLVSSITDPCPNCRRSLINILLRPNSTDTVRGMSRMRSRLLLSPPLTADSPASSKASSASSPASISSVSSRTSKSSFAASSSIILSFAFDHFSYLYGFVSSRNAGETFKFGVALHFQN